MVLAGKPELFAHGAAGAFVWLYEDFVTAGWKMIIQNIEEAF
jgi:hypothetical protein